MLSESLMNVFSIDFGRVGVWRDPKRKPEAELTRGF